MPNDVPRLVFGQVYRQSRCVTVVATTLMIAMMAGLPLAVVAAGRTAWWITTPLLLFAAFVTIALTRAAAKSFHAENWLLRIAPDGLWINLRSYQNRELAPAATVLYLPYSEIDAVQQHSIKRSERTNNRAANWTDHYLEILLDGPAIPELGAEIAEERRRRVTTEYFGGNVKSHSRSNHVPVTLPSDTLVRLAWRGRYDCIVPSLAGALRALADNCTVGPPTTKEAVDVASLSSNEVDSLILERVEQGETIRAINLLQEHRGYSLTDAKRFVDELTLRL